MPFCGFSVGNIFWLKDDLPVDDDSSPEALRRLREIGHEEARLTSATGGNCLRLFYFHGHLLEGLGVTRFVGGEQWETDYHLLPRTEKIAHFNVV
jgi:hypothetical protein